MSLYSPYNYVPNMPYHHYGAIFGWEPGENIATFRRNLLIIVGALIALIALVGILAFVVAK